jgi:phosphatidylglycerophosphatase GEP4
MQGDGERNLLPQPSREDNSSNNSGNLAPSSTGPRGPLAIWTTDVWERESMLMRWIEMGLVNVVERWTTWPKGQPLDTANFVKDAPPAPEVPTRRSGFVEELTSIFRKT